MSEAARHTGQVGHVGETIASVPVTRNLLRTQIPQVMLRDGAEDDGSGSGEGGSAESAGGAGGGISDDAWVEPNVVADPSRGGGDWGRHGRGGGDNDDEEELQLGGGARRLLGGEGGATDQGMTGLVG